MNFPLIVHCSTDEVFCRYWTEETKIPYKDLERTLPKVLVVLIEQHNPSSIIIINWPWWFTSLRIGTLCVTMASKNYNLPLYDRSKIDLYTDIIEQWVLPSQWYIAIGQRRNIWLYDFENNIAHMATAWTEHDIPKDYFIDMLNSHLLADTLNQTRKVQLLWSNEWLLCVFLWKKTLISWEILCNVSHKKETITPQYMIEPTLS